MNKTININLGGVFFHIDEDAYLKLKKYLETIRKSLSDDPQGKDEIIKDIEYRIGEILSERIKNIRQVVNEQDIDDIIIIMGKPEEYIGDEDFFEDETRSTSSNKGKSKKLFRDSNDKFLGGVSSGLSHYFGIDVIWIRLSWLLLLIGGFSVILYPILWILLPEANTTSEKLEMEGEPVNISNIERKIKEELTNASKLVKDGIEDVTNTIRKGNYESKVKSGLQEIIALLSTVFSAIFKVTGKFIGILLIIASVSSLLGILIGGFSLGSIEFLDLRHNLDAYPPFFYDSRIPLGLLTTFAFIAIAIPFVLLFKLGLRIISSNISSFSRATNLSLLGVWLLAIMGLTFAGIEYGANYNLKYSMDKKYVLENNNLETLKVKMIAMDGFKIRHNDAIKTTFINGIEKSYKTNIRLDIRESNTDEMYLIINKKARGLSVKKASEFTNDIEYKYNLINNTLLLDAYFLTDVDNKYKSQFIRMTLYIPKYKTVYLDKSIKYALNDVENVQDIYDRSMINHHFKMLDKGLNCMDCDTNKKNEKVIKNNIELTNISSDNTLKKNNANIDAQSIHNEIKQKLNEK